MKPLPLQTAGLRVGHNLIFLEIARMSFGSNESCLSALNSTAKCNSGLFYFKYCKSKILCEKLL